MAKKKRAVKRKKKKSTRKAPSLFKLASKNKSYKAAKRAKAKADARAKRVWKKSLGIAKKKLRRMKYC